MLSSIKHNPHCNQYLSSMTRPPGNRISVHARIWTAVQEEGTHLWEVSQISFLIQGRLPRISKEQDEVSKPAMLHGSSHVPQYHSSVQKTTESCMCCCEIQFYRITNTYWYHITKDYIHLLICYSLHTSSVTPVYQLVLPTAVSICVNQWVKSS